MRISEEGRALIHELHEAGQSARSIAETVGCGIASVYRILNPNQDSLRADFIRYARTRRTNFRQEIQAIKLERGCADCGYNAHPAALDFDHRKGEVKLFTIGAVGSSQSREALLAEIAKCDVVCANCHRIRTDGRGWGTNHR